MCKVQLSEARKHQRKRSFCGNADGCWVMTLLLAAFIRVFPPAPRKKKKKKGNVRLCFSFCDSSWDLKKEEQLGPSVLGFVCTAPFASQHHAESVWRKQGWKALLPFSCLNHKTAVCLPVVPFFLFYSMPSSVPTVASPASEAGTLQTRAPFTVWPWLIPWTLIHSLHRRCFDLKGKSKWLWYYSCLNSVPRL